MEEIFKGVTRMHYVCGLRIGGEDYTVHALVAVDDKGNRYYDHNLVNIEKGKLLDHISGQAVIDGFGATPSTKLTTNSERKVNKLISLLQTNEQEIRSAESRMRDILDERPWLADDKVKINLGKPDGLGKVDKVDHNPYIHIRPNMVNKQFKNAWERRNLVYVKMFCCELNIRTVINFSLDFSCTSPSNVLSLLSERASLGGKVTPPTFGFEGGVVKVPFGDVLFLSPNISFYLASASSGLLFFRVLVVNASI